MAARIVKCLQCDKKFEYAKSEFRPFCSDRCKMMDLGNWLDEAYKIPVEDEFFDEQGYENGPNEFEQ